MENSTHPIREKSQDTPLKYAFDGQLLPATPPDENSVKTTESNNKDSHTGESTKSPYSDRSWTTDLAMSLRVMGESMLKTELAELEMMKKREIARAEAELQRARLEHEMTRMMLQTQLQMFLRTALPERESVPPQVKVQVLLPKGMEL